MGAWDRRVAGWLAGLDTCTALTIASWIARSRGGGAVSGMRISSARAARAGSVVPRSDSAAICRAAAHPSLR